MPMMPSSQQRTTDTHALSSSVPTSLSSSSLSSSLSSSRASSDLLPAAPPSNSSQSDIVTSDRSVSSLSSSSKPRFFPLVLTSAPPRTASLANMGQSHSRLTPTASPPPLSPAPSTSSSTGGRLKRAWAGRRKKSEDVTALFSNSQRSEKGMAHEPLAAPAPPPSAMPDLNEPRLERPPSRGAGGPKLLNLQNVFGGKKAAQQSKAGKLSSPVPPPPPPKPASVGQRAPSTSPPSTPAKDVYLPPASPVSRPSLSSRPAPGPRESAEGRDSTPSVAAEKVTGAQEKEKTKEDWRKSDSTMASHSTIRPGALSGNRSPRPVSLAESSHSATTIVPPVNKRLSALITDAEFTMFEEADNGAADDSNIRPPASGRPSPTGSMKARNRRSASLNLGPLRKPNSQDAAGKATGPHSPGRVLSDCPLSSRDTTTLTRAAAAGIIAPVNAVGSAQTGNNIRGRLAAWTAASTPPPARAERPLPAPPPPQPRRQPGAPHPPPVNPTFRQTAVSMTGSLAPAAGFAMGFGKRAVEKVGRAWGGFSSTSSNHSGYSSSSSTGAVSSSSKVSDMKARRKAAPGFSGGSSISSFASTSSEDHFTPTGPQLGRRLRGPRRTSSGHSIVGGLVFKRDLQTCVRETAIEDVRTRLASDEDQDSNSGFKPLESRRLPALVVRCAQHILRWGIQEEGLFRVSGRSSHVAKLRSEFDAGSDYDLTECEPVDLDPHAVASIFKAFLREMPEPLLTSALSPYFESALTEEEGSQEDSGSSPRAQPPVHQRHGSNLPLRKPPSLSTLAMPSFAGMRPMSDAQLNALAFLVSKLPPENRDLLYTVVELIKVTAARSKETKMPLGNLLLVFCPSLNMNPALLRVLCEADSIWNGPEQREFSSERTEQPPNQDPADQQEEPMSIKPTAPTIDLRLPVIETEDISPISQNDSLGDDAASFVSALEPCSNAPTRSPSPAVYGTPIPPLSSSESLDSICSDELASPDPPSCKATGESKSALASANSLAIPETTDLSLPATPRLVTDAPVPFPSAGGSVPQTPSTHPPISHRKSYTLLSFPHLRSESSPDVLCNAQSGTKRPKRPSLHLLFSKKSSSSLPSASGSANASTVALTPSDGNPNISAPLPIAHVASSPPRLDTAISSSPIHLAFEEAAKQMKGKDTVRSAPPSTMRSEPEAPALDVRSDSGGSSVFSTPRSTPIADFYRGRTTSLFFPETSNDISVQTRARSATQVSETPSLRISVTETQQGDWMQSVLLAAQAGQSPTS
ncbi:RhoGAP-domain-containing protein [Pilatotrama ljubarskyi]|nr:RhoGAP-domain-containing protein [Pilatotrama ljubarskyi]